MESRITELECRYSYLERQLEELSQTLYQQQRTLDRVLGRLEQIEHHVRELSDESGATPGHEKPPHY
jgi:SlyX protein